MSVLVEDLLLLARLDEGRPIAAERVELRTVVSEAVETGQMLEPARPIFCELGDAAVRGDHDPLRQIVDNLLANVRAHTPPGTPVRVTLTAAGGTGGERQGAADPRARGGGTSEARAGPWVRSTSMRPPPDASNASTPLRTPEPVIVKENAPVVTSF